MASDIHIFHTSVAEEVGLEAAILLENINYWVEHNKDNNQNFHDGKYWTYNSVKAFKVQFPFMSARKISTVLNLLCQNGYLEKGNYNTSPYDHTTWYTTTEKAQSILPNRQNENTKRKIESLPEEKQDNDNIYKYNNNSNKPDNKLSINDSETQKRSIGHDTSHESYNESSKNRRKVNAKTELVDCVDAYTEDEKVRELLYQWLEGRKEKGSLGTVHAIELNLNKLNEFAQKANMSVTEYLEEVVRRNWIAFVDPAKDKYGIFSKIQKSAVDDWRNRQWTDEDYKID